jgi:hypothetical protein
MRSALRRCLFESSGSAMARGKQHTIDTENQNAENPADN